MKRWSIKSGALLLSLSMLFSCLSVQALAEDESDIPNEEITYMSAPLSEDSGFQSESLLSEDFQSYTAGATALIPLNTANSASPFVLSTKAYVWADNYLNLKTRVRAVFDEPVSEGKLYAEFEALTNSGCLGVALMSKQETNTGVWAFGMENDGVDPELRYFNAGGYPPDTGTYETYKDGDGNPITVTASANNVWHKYKLTVDLDNYTVRVDVEMADGTKKSSVASGEYANLRENAPTVYGLVFRNQMGKTIGIDKIKVYKEDNTVIYASDFDEAYSGSAVVPTSVWGNDSALNSAVKSTDANLAVKKDISGTPYRLGMIQSRAAAKFIKSVSEGAFCIEFDAMTERGALAVSLIYENSTDFKKWIFGQGHTAGRLGMLKTWTEEGVAPPNASDGLVNLIAESGEKLNFTTGVWEHYKIIVDIDNQSVRTVVTDSFGKRTSAQTVYGYPYFGGGNSAIGGIGFRTEYSNVKSYIDNISVYTAESERIFYIEKPVIVSDNLNAGNTASAELTYIDTDRTARDFNLFLAAYNKNDELIGVSIKPISTSGTDYRRTISAEPLSISEDAEKIKAFVWDNNFKPLCCSGIIERAPVACWGDSLTYGVGASNPSVNSYPKQLAQMIGKNVINMGVPGETALTIAARQGAYDITIGEDVTIPASGAVELTRLTSTGGNIAPCSNVSGGWNPCTLGGIKGSIMTEVSENSPPKDITSITFTRAEAGEEVTLPAGTKLVTNSQKTKADWNVIFVGTNGGWSADNLTASEHLAAGDADKLVKLIGDMINHTPNSEKCLIIGLTAGGTKYEPVNTALAEAFGNKFIDAKAYLATAEALSAAGITATEADNAAIAERAVPPSLLSDAIHFNGVGYELLAQLVYNKLTELGFEN